MLECIANWPIVLYLLRLTATEIYEDSSEPVLFILSNMNNNITNEQGIQYNNTWHKHTLTQKQFTECLSKILDKSLQMNIKSHTLQKKHDKAQTIQEFTSDDFQVVRNVHVRARLSSCSAVHNDNPLSSSADQH